LFNLIVKNLCILGKGKKDVLKSQPLLLKLKTTALFLARMELIFFVAAQWFYILDLWPKQGR